jgi:hypothetical protein
MKLRYLAASLGCALASMAFAGSAQATAITTRWDDIKLTHDQCLAHAETAIHAGGFKSLPHTLQSRHDTDSNYTVAVRCLTEMHVVFFVVAGPSRQRTPVLMDRVHHQFKF